MIRKLLLGLTCASLTLPAFGQSTISGTTTFAVTNAGTFAVQNTAGTPCATTALAGSIVCNAAASTVLDFTVTADSTLNAAAWYVMLSNTTTVPGDGAVTPAKCYQIPAGQSQFGGTFGTGGVSFGTGLSIYVSTTGCFTKTVSAHALFIGATYR